MREQRAKEAHGSSTEASRIGTRRMLRGGVAGALAILGSVATVAIADTVTINEVGVSGDSQKTVGQSGQLSVHLTVDDNATDPVNGCNASSTAPVTVRLESSNPSAVSLANSGEVVFTTCDTKQLAYQAVGAGSATVETKSVTGGRTVQGNSPSYTKTDTHTIAVSGPSDTTPPVIGRTITPAPNTAGWNNGALSVSWTATDLESAVTILSGCGTQNFSTETAGTTSSCSAQSAGGSSSDSVTIKIDSTKPVISGSTGTYTPGTWTNQSVTVSFGCADAGAVQSGLKTNTVAGDTLTGSGADQSLTNTGACTDVADNTADAVEIGNIDIDKVKPVNSVTGISPPAQYVLGAPGPTLGCDTSDALSGVASSATLGQLTGTGTTNPNGVGVFTATCTGGADNAGNSADAAHDSYSVVYGMGSGIGQPINADGNSVFSQKRAVPVKFSLPGDESVGGFDVSGWALKLVGAACGTESSWDPEMTPETTSTNTGLRYDATADQYIANATLAGTTVNKCYRFTVALDDGTVLQSPKFKVGK